MNHFLFIQSDYEALQSSIDDLKEQIKQIKIKVGESTSHSSESWHDNIEHEELMRRHDLYMTHLRDKEQIQRSAKVVAKENSKDTIGLGSKVFYEDDNGTELSIAVGSYRVFSEDPTLISYASPLGELFIGHKTDDTITGVIGGKKRHYTIVAVEN